MDGGPEKDTPRDRQETPLKKAWLGRNIIFYLGSAHFTFTENLLCVMLRYKDERRQIPVLTPGDDVYSRITIQCNEVHTLECSRAPKHT